MHISHKSILKRRILCGFIAVCLLCGVFSGCAKKESSAPSLKATAVSHETEFGGIYIEITIDDFNKLGFAYGDSVNITFSNGYELKDLPYYSGYYTHSGEPLLVAYPGYPYIRAGINNGDDLWKIANLSDGDTATISLAEAGTYRNVQNARAIYYEDIREKFPSDEVFANFRAVSVTGLKENVLYRSASPCDNQHNRAPYVDRLIKDAGMKTIIDLADTVEKIDRYISSDGFNSPYFLSLYETGSVFPLALSMNFDSDDFRQKLARGMIAIAENDGPYLVHCTEGKDRTGFVCMLLEAFCGASYAEIVEDYMITYDNYYQISTTQQKDKYDTIVDDVLNPMVYHIAGDENADLNTVDLASCAAAYLLKIGLTEDQIQSLRERLCRE